MDWTSGLQRAVDYVERHITEKIDYAEVARQAYCSEYHFLRVFGLICGVTLGEYIRSRRLSLAGEALLAGGKKVCDVAYEYGYESPESFSRAFAKFHGVNPSAVCRGCVLKTYAPLCVALGQKGGKHMEYTIQQMPKLTLVGYKKRFSGTPSGAERLKQEEAFFCSTRAKQWLLIGASANYENDYCVVTNVGDDGYDFYIAYEMDEWTRQELYNPAVTGVGFMKDMGFEVLEIPSTLCAVFETSRQKHPTDEYADIRRRIATEWLPNSGYQLADAPEVVSIYWRVKQKKDWAKNRYVQIRLPIEKAKRF